MLVTLLRLQHIITCTVTPVRIESYQHSDLEFHITSTILYLLQITKHWYYNHSSTVSAIFTLKGTGQGTRPYCVRFTLKGTGQGTRP